MQRHGLNSGILSKQKSFTHTESTLHDSIYEKLCVTGKIKLWSKHHSGCLRWGRYMTEKGQERTFWGDGNLHFDRAMSLCTSVHIILLLNISKKSIKLSKETVGVGRYGWTRMVGSWQLLKLRNGHMMYIHSAVYVLHKNIFQMWKGIIQQAILEWVAFPFSKGSSQPRDQTQVSHTAGRFFTRWVTREA